MRYGIIGGGGMARTHASHVLRHPHATLVACAAPDFTPDMQTLTHAAGIPCYSDATRLLSQPGIDAVLIATPTDTHAQLTIAALTAGMHVFVEKPLARTVAEGTALVAAANRAQKKLLCGHVVRYFAEYAQSHELIVNGAI